MSATSTRDDLLGHTTLGHNGAYKHHSGPLASAARQGGWLLLDEINLASGKYRYLFLV